MGFFDWLRYGISHGYETGSNCADCPHYAVDIGTPYHTPITALWSGTVTSQRTGLPWGTEVFVKPDNGLPTYYYYHLDQLNTSVGQHLNAGDVIGLSGGQNSGGSNPSSSTYSSGVHTHVGFFQSYRSSANGGRPFGPDITPYIHALLGGVISGSTDTPPSSSTTSSSTATSDLARWGEKIGLFLLALSLLGFGFYLLFQKQVNEAVKKTGSVAVKAAVL